MGGSEERQLCAKGRKCNIEEKTRTKVTKVPERKCEQIPYNRQVCRPEAVPQPPQMVSVERRILVCYSDKLSLDNPVQNRVQAAVLQRAQARV